MHLIEVQERKRQLLKARAELQSQPATTDKSDLLSAWDDEDDKADIPDEVQVSQSLMVSFCWLLSILIRQFWTAVFNLQNRLLSEYERELIAKKLEKSKIGSESSEKESDMVIVGSEDASPVEKGSHNFQLNEGNILSSTIRTQIKLGQKWWKMIITFK